MWGARVARDRKRNRELLYAMLTHRSAAGRLKYGNDQNILIDVLWPTIHAALLRTHASFHCRLFDNFLPFPTRRRIEPNNAVGGRMNTTLKRMCPPQCRRKPDWVLC